MAGKGQDREEGEEEEAAATPLQHPSHPHTLFPCYFLTDKPCNLCNYQTINEEYYSCTTCNFYAHKKCVEAPPLIPRHHLHPFHPLSLSHDRPSFTCYACDGNRIGLSCYECDECGLFLHLHCVLFLLPDLVGSSEKPIEIPIHDHPLISLPHRSTLRTNCKCTLCGFLITREEDAYTCLHPGCKFLIHKRRCIQDLYYEDGSRVPRVYHQHELTTFSAKEGKPFLGCGNCESDVSSGEHLGCETCRVFYHRDCVKFPETLQYPLHPNHDALVLFIFPRDNRATCQFCDLHVYYEELFYRCTGCDFTVHANCGLQIFLYHEKGRGMEIALSWHEHPLILGYSKYPCSCGGEQLYGPTYICTAHACNLELHEGCTNQSSEINHPHHPEHPLVLLPTSKNPRPRCNVCCEMTFDWSFSCELCQFYLHIGCASQFPTQKHYLHEHDLIRFEQIWSLECNRCGTRTDSPLLRCVPCDFNLHEKCTELPGVVKHKTHHHPLTLRDSFMEDDTGEYYCDLCEKRRDGRLGVYMCLQCKMLQPWVFHIECILPELLGVNVKKVRYSVLKESAEEVAKMEGQLLALEKKAEETKQELEETKQVLEELRKRHAELSLLKVQGKE